MTTNRAAAANPSSDPYRAPHRSDFELDGLDSALQMTRTHPVVVAAVICTMVGGLLLVLSALQLWAFAYRGRGWLTAVPIVMLLVGFSAMWLGTRLYRQRLWAAIAALAACGLATLATGAWLLLSVANGLFSLIGLLAPLVLLAATILILIALKPIGRACYARREMRTRGLSIDF